MTDLLSRPPIAWPFLVNVVVAFATIAVARLQVARHARTAAAASAPHPTAVAHPPRDAERLVDTFAAATPTPPTIDTLPAPMPIDTWAALVLTRLHRLAALDAAAADECDGVDLLHRARYATYLDWRQLERDVRARALSAEGVRLPEVTNV